MRLATVQVRDFQSIRDSTPFSVDDVTCLVGKNEAGKTALLKAIYRLNPIKASDAKYDVTDDYPRSTVANYQAQVEDGKRRPAKVLRASFELEEQDVASLVEVYGSNCVADNNPIITVHKDYNNEIFISGLDVDDNAALEYLICNADLPTSVESSLLESDSLEAKIKCLGQSEADSESAKSLRIELSQIQKHGFATHVYRQILKARIPKFLYFDEYYQLRGQDNIEALERRMREDQLEPPDYPLLGLIELAGLNLDILKDPRRTETLISKLEAAENELTRKVLKYWSQNQHLRLRFDVRQAQPEDPSGMTDGMNIWGRVHDTKHSVSTTLGSRSRGFVWFFSFLAWYSKVLRDNGNNLILLLDEPGLSLHAKAQADLLQYFEAELVPHHQIIYTTHSPFMVDPSRFDRVRIVQDLSIERDSALLSSDQEGTKVTTNVLDAGADSLFPLQAALGYDIHQALFIGPNNLIVEGASDLLYIQAISELLQAHDREGLSADWIITPVGGFDKVSTFVALIGAQSGMTLATLVDYECKNQQTIQNLFQRKLMKKSNVLTFAEFVEADEADVEDMFTPDFYIELVNREFDTSIKVEDLPSQDNRIIRRLEGHLKANPLPDGAGFNHYRPARYLIEHLHTLEIPAQTLDRFERAFGTLNKLLS